MALKLALFEGLSLFAAVSGAILLWAHPLRMSWFDSLIVLGKASTIPLCCAVSFYYNDLYDLRIVPSFGKFAWRLLQGSGVAFMLLAGLYWLLPDVNISTEAFSLSLFFILTVLLGLRALTYGLMRQRPFLQRVLILGTSCLAHKIIRDIETRPYLRYSIVGVVDAAPGVAEIAAEIGTGPAVEIEWLIDGIGSARSVRNVGRLRRRHPTDGDQRHCARHEPFHLTLHATAVTAGSHPTYRAQCQPAWLRNSTFPGRIYREF